ncbi:MAG: adenylate/guanylate cyclase domain-containing protein [Candidatus Ancaeobacter aquaticus]|nr:adenylate/guanylate cyclase domain-containing protein [Candidatus Ancaeobacter aquaticus]
MNRKTKIIQGIVTAVAVFLVVVLLDHTSFLQTFEFKTYDWRCRVLSDSDKAGRNIVLFYIDQASIDHYANNEGINWPWPRGMYKPVVDFCMQGGAAALVFDMLYTETSSFGSEDDEDFAQSIKEYGAAYFAFFGSKKEKKNENDKSLFIDKGALNVQGIENSDLIEYFSYTPPIKELLKATKGVGNVAGEPDQDGVFRRAPIVSRIDKNVFPFLAFAPYKTLLSADSLRYRDEVLSVGDRNIPVDRQGRMIIRYYGSAGCYKAFSIGDIIQSAVRIQSGLKPIYESSIVKDKIVFVGCSAPGLMDLRVTPFSSIYPGAEVHATVLDNILQRDFIREMPKEVVYAISLLIALIIGIIVYSLQSVRVICVLISMVLVLFVSIDMLLFKYGVLFEMMAPLMCFFITVMVSSIINYATEGRNKRKIKQAFQQYSSPIVVNEILKYPEKLKLGGERKELTVFFSDIAGFTTISERMEPEKLVDILNEYLNEVGDVILSYAGTVDKFLGDAVMALWGAPLSQNDHAARACYAALDCQKMLLVLNESLKQRELPELNTRIGISSGIVLVGNMGSHKRFDYTVIGDTVNLGARLESANKIYGSKIMISQRTRELAGDTIEARELDLVKVKGKNKPIRVYELLSKKGELSQSILDALKIYHEGLEAYRQREWDKASTIFKDGLRLSPHDSVAQLYVQRIEDSKKQPPGDDWDGVSVLQSK